jgi:uncharacterized repeat protein (TIGR02543 family)
LGTLVFDYVYLGTATTKYKLLTESGTGGTVALLPDTEYHDSGSVVTATALPMTGYSFKQWSGASSSTSNPVDITMDASYTLTANFEETVGTQYTLTTSAGTGGSVSPSGTNAYDAGTEVEIVAMADTGYNFDGWEGASTATNDTITITMDADKSLTASFSIKTYTLTTGANNSSYGSVSVDPDQASYEHGTEVTIVATPADGYRFDNWTGFPGTNDTITTTMEGDMTVTANFSVANGIPSHNISHEHGTAELFPNPVAAGQALTVGLMGFESEKDIAIQIMDISGRIAYSTSVKTHGHASQRVGISTEGLSAGMYMVVVRGSNKIINQRLIIR